MSDLADPRRDPDAVLASIDQALEQAGYATSVVEPPQADNVSLVATVELGPGRRREAIVVFDQHGNCPLYLSRPHGADDPDSEAVDLADAQHFATVQCLIGVGDDVVRRIREAVALSTPDDERATLAELRSSLEFISGAGRNTSSMGNQRGDDIASLAKTMARLVDRIERLEQGGGSDGRPLG